MFSPDFMSSVYQDKTIEHPKLGMMSCSGLNNSFKTCSDLHSKDKRHHCSELRALGKI